MHGLIKHIERMIGISLLVIITILISTNANSEQSSEDIIKNRKALFSKNYNTAKKVQSLSSNGDFDEAKELMLEMSENYIALKEMFPENTKEGFKTEVTPLIWEEKEKFNSLMEKSSNDMVQLISIIEDEDDIRGTLGKLMWSNCKACHSKYRLPH
jgi:cytochrome c556